MLWIYGNGKFSGNPGLEIRYDLGFIKAYMEEYFCELFDSGTK
jgi:hypothetical protein